jgi:hypothetical protein
MVDGLSLKVGVENLGFFAIFGGSPRLALAPQDVDPALTLSRFQSLNLAGESGGTMRYFWIFWINRNRENTNHKL